MGGGGRVVNKEVGHEGVVAQETRDGILFHDPVGGGERRCVAVRDETVTKFLSGATRSSETTFDPSGFISPAVLVGFSRYMEKHRRQADGGLRAADNWQKGMPTSRAIRSLVRHFFDFWLMSRGYRPNSADCETPEDALHAIMFNVQVILKNRIDGNHHEQDGDASNSAPRWEKKT